MELKRLCRNCRFFFYIIHHASDCDLKKKNCWELRDGRAEGCEEWKKKLKKK